METLKKEWNNILETMRNDYDLNGVSFRTWIMPLEIHSVEDGVLYLLYNITTDSKEIDQIHINHINKKYVQYIGDTIKKTTGASYIIKIVMPRDIKTDLVEAAPKKTPDHDTEKYKKSNLNPRYTFDTFVVGGSNRFAQSASLAVAETPGEVYNPLYIYGGPGLGKTHLMHAIGNFIYERNSDAKVLYVTSEIFVNEVIESIRSANSTTNMSKLRDKYRKVDVLMIDDIQFMIGKESTQEEFFHTFNTLYEAGKQIILTSDRPPKDLETLEERIRTRFEMGLMADIGEPDYETRMAIIRSKIEHDHIDFPNEVLEYIANNIRSNVREIEGALNKLVAFQSLQNIEVTLEVATRELQNIIAQDKPREITAQLIIEVVAEYYNVTMDQMVSKDRKKTIARPRQVAMYLCREMISSPLGAIGKLLGGRNHATIIHGYDKIVEEMNTDSKLQWDIDTLKNKINPQ